MKKINAIISWILILCMLGHMGIMSCTLITGWYSSVLVHAVGGTALVMAIVHAAFSIIIMFFFNDGASLKYKRLNVRTLIQRISALVMIVMVHFHMNAYSFMTENTELQGMALVSTLVTEILFSASILSHVATSFSKSFVTLGVIRTEKTENILNNVAAIVCAVLFVLAAVATISGLTN